MKTRPFPVGHPRVLTREQIEPALPWTEAQQNGYKGVLKVRVLPSSTHPLRIPLLPYRTLDGRLTFPLCAKCADKRQQRPCRHEERQRSWVAAYTHVELNRALQLGYRVLECFEVWHYEQWDGELFRRYVNTFVGLKQQASGWPAGCDTHEQRRAYLEEFERAEGIHLDEAQVAPNPGLRHIAV